MSKRDQSRGVVGRKSAAPSDTTMSDNAALIRPTKTAPFWASVHPALGYEIPRSCDIFCNVIDNYGDIGVCWRLARLLAHEHGLAVRLWVDDLCSLARLCHEADAARDIQRCRGVEVRRWAKPFAEAQPAELVIEAFACKLPQNYIEAMAAQQRSVWINLEYLSAEDWVEGCHKLPSPHPSLPLTKYFFFPGFTRQTGGLLLEHDLFARRDAFWNAAAQQQAFWRSFGMEMPGAETLKISLFGYENDALAELLDAWANGAQPVLCLVPEGRILPQVEQYFAEVGRNLSRHASCVGINPDLRSYSCGSLQVRVLPFVEQERYDELLWACDVNFVRGEDSCVRAQWAGKPFVWQIYPQHDAAHWQKLQAFLKLYCAPLGMAASQAVQGLWREWNNEDAAGKAWTAFVAAYSELDLHAQGWARELAENDLALNLLDFSCEIGRMRAFKIEEQQT
ncbi:MAG: elongation factor P maturation arginine rhamnosyltransferase EarP [Gallionella sp.]|nr:elongation factor P maturation arginine rhamnosyltransferase EarP [Gallionella sp.]